MPILYSNAAAIDHQLILCHGKECQELTPVLRETLERLREMAQDLAPDDFLFVAGKRGTDAGCRWGKTACPS